MATLVVFKFPTAEGAETMLYTLETLQKQQLIQIEDGAIVTWPAGASKPKTKQISDMTGAGALGGAFWGLLFGLLFFVPFLGLAVGAAMGALAGHFAHYGIDESFINQVRSKITPGTSALFLLTSEAVVDRVAEAVKGQQFEIIQTNLSKEQEVQLKEAFGYEPVPGETPRVPPPPEQPKPEPKPEQHPLPGEPRRVPPPSEQPKPEQYTFEENIVLDQE